MNEQFSKVDITNYTLKVTTQPCCINTKAQQAKTVSLSLNTSTSLES